MDRAKDYDGEKFPAKPRPDGSQAMILNGFIKVNVDCKTTAAKQPKGWEKPTMGLVARIVWIVCVD